LREAGANEVLTSHQKVQPGPRSSLAALNPDI
jgi:hypothetical protein